jgi:hypothetical protein
MYLTPVKTTFRGLCLYSSFVHALHCQVSDEVTALATTLAHHTMDKRMKTVRSGQGTRTLLTSNQAKLKIICHIIRSLPYITNTTDHFVGERYGACRLGSRHLLSL